MRSSTPSRARARTGVAGDPDEPPLKRHKPCKSNGDTRGGTPLPINPRGGFLSGSSS